MPNGDQKEQQEKGQMQCNDGFLRLYGAHELPNFSLYKIGPAFPSLLKVYDTWQRLTHHGQHLGQ